MHLYACEGGVHALRSVGLGSTPTLVGEPCLIGGPLRLMKQRGIPSQSTLAQRRSEAKPEPKRHAT